MSKSKHQSPPKLAAAARFWASWFRAPRSRNPSAGLAPQAPFRKCSAPVTCAFVLVIVLESYGVFARPLVAHPDLLCE